MDIAAVASMMSQDRLIQQVSLSVTKKAMDSAEVQMQGLMEMIEAVPPAGVGENVNLLA